MGNGLADDVWWQTIRTLGSGEGIDRPAGTWPNLTMSWIPVYSKDCVFCTGRTARGELPYCTSCCPTRAMTYGDLDDVESDISKRLADLRDKGFRIFSLPAWEQSRKEILYASKK
jgi:Fe-S-cluster-containing dehydrogenase component